MKHIKHFLLTMLVAWVSIGASAWDFSYTYQGKTLYYSITSATSKTVAVVHKSDGSFGSDGTPYRFTAYVADNVTIPSTVSYNGSTYQVTSIDKAFVSCAGLTSISIPSSVVSIGDNAFNSCTELSSISLPSSVTSIGQYAFNNCTGLETITIPSNVTTIDRYAFSGCTGLVSATIKSGEISGGAFANCENLLSVTIGASVTGAWWSTPFSGCSSLTRVNISDLSAWCKKGWGQWFGTSYSLYLNGSKIQNLTIPSDVTEVASYAFAGCNFTSVTIHSGVTQLGECAFQNCGGVLYVNCDLGNYYDCDYNDDGDLSWESYNSPFKNSKFTKIVIGSGVSKIGVASFYNCKELTSITIPSSLTHIASNAFKGCNDNSAGQVNINDLAAWCKIKFDSNPCNYFHHLYLNGTEIKNLTIPSSVTSISANAFSGCASLTSVDLPAKMTSIGTGAFNSCTGLQKVNIHDLSAWCKIDFGSNPCGYAHHLYLNGSEITNLSIPSDVTRIAASAFSGCSYLISVDIPTSVTSVGFSAFYGCVGLQRVDIHDLSAWCKTTFGNNPCQYAHHLYLNGNEIIELSIPSDVTSIAASAFSGCSFLTSANLANVRTIGSSVFSSCTSLTFIDFANVTSIDNSAFSGCTSLTSVDLNNVTRIGGYAFRGCTSLTSVDFAHVMSVGNNAFSGCTSLTSADLANVTSIGSSVFSECASLTSVALANVTNISDNAFSGCTSLISVELGNATRIGGSAFSNCTKLLSVEIPSSVTSIQKSAFSGCSGLTSLTIPSSVTYLGEAAFYGCTGTVNVNCNLSNFYYYDSYYDDDERKYIDATCSSPFYRARFDSIVVGEGVTTLGDYAFFYNTQNYWDGTLKSITIPPSVKRIGKSAFTGRNGLTQVNISDVAAWCKIDFASYDANPCYYAKHLYCDGEEITKVTIDNSVTAVGNYAFYNCASIKQFDLPASVTSIGQYAFSGCSPDAFVCRSKTPPSMGSYNQFGGSKKIFVPSGTVDSYKNSWTAFGSYTFLPVLDVEVLFFDKQTLSSYSAEMAKQAKAKVKGVAFYGDVDASLTEEALKQDMNPNCLFYVPDQAPLRGTNIVNFDKQTAEKVVLTDEYPFYAPTEFTAKEISYVHNPKVWANGKSGWEAICLPFAVDTYIANQTGYLWPITLGAQGNFWLRKFMGSSNDAVFFSSTLDGQMEANVPYIVAFPGASMGKGHLQGQTITFSAKNVTVPVTTIPNIKKGGFMFVGNYDTEVDEVSEGWKLDDAGSVFSFAYEVGDEPFSAYFVPEGGAMAGVRALRIEYVTEMADGVLLPEADGGALETRGTTARGTFDLQGRRVAEAGAMKSGLYIKDGRKVVVR